MPHRGTAHSVTISANGIRLAIAVSAAGVEIWDTTLLQRVQVLQCDSTPYCLTYSPDGRHLAVGCLNGDLLLFDAITGNRQATLRGHAARINCIAFGGANQRIASGSYDRTVRLWNTATGHCVAVLHGPGDYVTTVAFCDQDRLLLTLHGQRSLLAWDADDATEVPVPVQISH